MFTHFKKRFEKSEFILILFLLLSSFVKSQPLGLQPELEMNAGLRHNSVRAIIQDNRQRTYLGTESGMKILDSHHPYLDTIVRQTENVPIISINMLGKFLFLGTVSSGLKIYDLQQHRQVRHPLLDSIRYVRRIRMLQGSIYVAANSASWKITYKNGTIHLQKIHRPESKGFITDFTTFQDNIIAFDLYAGTCSRVYKIVNNRAIEIPYPPGIRVLPDLTILTGNGGDKQTVVAGDGFYDLIANGEVKQYETLRDSSLNINFPVWEMIRVKDRIFLALGQQYKLEMGLAYQVGVNTMKDIRGDFFCQSFYYNKLHDALWIGTYNRGLFVWPRVSLSQRLPEDLRHLVKMVSAQDSTFYLHNQKNLFSWTPKTGRIEQVKAKKTGEEVDDILQVEKLHDTLAVLRTNNLTLYDIYNREISKYPFLPNQFNHFRLLGDSIFFFAMHNAGVFAQHISNKGLKKLQDVSIVSTSKSYRNGYVYFTDEKGFFFHDTVVKELKSPLTKIQEFHIMGDKLLVLLAGRVIKYKINLDAGKLEEQKSILYAEVVREFVPNWMKLYGDKLFIGNNRGFLEVNPENLNPLWYSYLGNYKSNVSPMVQQDTLYMLQDGYLEKQPLRQPYPMSSFKHFKITLESKGELYARFPISINVNHHDYFLQRYALKRLELETPEGDTRIFYSLDSIFQFPSGLTKGKYKAKLYVNNNPAAELQFRITIPLLQNPVFYVILATLVIIVFYQLFRYRSKRKELELNMLDSRLQLLKKNLDPHFIFNSLNQTYMLLLQGRNEEASKSIVKFSDLHRYFLEMLNQKEVSLKEELGFVSIYLQLEQARHSGASVFDFSMPEPSEQWNRIKLPPLILQPLVENAIKYGGAEGQDKFTIHIGISFHGSKAILFIENSLSLSNSHQKVSLKKGVATVQEIISIYNRMGLGSIGFKPSVPALISNPGYRCELEFKC